MILERAPLPQSPTMTQTKASPGPLTAAQLALIPTYSDITVDGISLVESYRLLLSEVQRLQITLRTGTRVRPIVCDCGSDQTDVYATRRQANKTIRRERECLTCQGRFDTREGRV